MPVPLPSRALRGPTLVRHFGLLALAVIGVLTAVLIAVLAREFREDLFEREWSLTADHVRTAIRQHLHPGDLTRPITSAAQRRLERLAQQTIAMPEVVRLAVYDAERRLVWRDDATSARDEATATPQFDRALLGEPVVNLAPGQWPLLFLGEQNEFARLVEVYVPVLFPAASRVAGVVVVGKLPRQVFASIRRGQLTLAASAAAGGLILYLALFGIVVRAAGRIEEQHLALERRSEEVSAANQELRAVQGQLVAAERMAAIGEVVTAVAHGIRNPLANIRASAQVATLGGEAAPHLANITAEVDRLEGRLKEMLHFVRPAGPERLPVDLNAEIAEVLRSLAGAAEAAHVALSAVPAPALPRVLGNRMLLEQVLLSLVANAIDASPRGGTVTVSTDTAGDGDARTVRVRVQDAGPGIGAEQLAHIFEPFYTTKAKGTGLGLAIAQKFTEAQQGRLAVRSAPGETVFTVTFPALEEGAAWRP